MKFFFCSFVILFISCKEYLKNNDLNPSEGDNELDIRSSGKDAYGEKINFDSVSLYEYTLANKTAVDLEMNDRSVMLVYKSTISVTYIVKQDSDSNYILILKYNKIHVYSKNGDNETELDADHSAATLDPTEKMLGLLKTANISAIVSPSGKVIAIDGYKELGEKILSSFNTNEASRNLAKAQWEKIIGEGMVKKSIEQLFDVLPETKKKVGDTWSRETQQKGEFNMAVATTFKLKDISDGVARVESEGEMISDKGEVSLMGYSVTSDLKGKQEGTIEVETSSGIVLKNNTTSKLKGSMQIMGKEIPVTINTTLTMIGKKSR